MSITRGSMYIEPPSTKASFKWQIERGNWSFWSFVWRVFEFREWLRDLFSTIRELFRVLKPVCSSQISIVFSHNFFCNIWPLWFIWQNSEYVIARGREKKWFTRMSNTNHHNVRCLFYTHNYTWITVELISVVHSSYFLIGSYLLVKDVFMASQPILLFTD